MAEEKLVDFQMDLDHDSPIPELTSDEENQLLATTEMVLSNSPLDLSSSIPKQDLSNFKIPKKVIPITDDLLSDILKDAPPKYQSPLLKLDMQPIVPQLSYKAMAIPNSEDSYQLHIPELKSLFQNPMKIPDRSIFTGKPIKAKPVKHEVPVITKHAHYSARGRGAKKSWGPHDSISKMIHSQVRAQVRKQLRGKPQFAQRPMLSNNNPPIYYHLEKLAQQLRNQTRNGTRGARGAARGRHW